MRNVFLDTNVLMEYYCNREKADCVEKILCLAINDQIRLHISAGSLYTMAYLVEKHLKCMGLNGKEKIYALRTILHNVLQLCKTETLEDRIFDSCLVNDNFRDIEDCFQFQTAINSGCDVLLTFNIKDFPVNTDIINVVTPVDYLKQITDRNNN